MKISEIDLLTTLSRPSVHPDGSSVVVAASRPDLSSDSYVGQLWQVDLPHGKPRRVTRGRHDSAPQFSPDGALIAFLRQVEAGPSQLVVMPSTGGEPLSLTDRALGVNSFRWAPDSLTIAFLSRDPEGGRYGTVEGLAGDSEPPRHITTQRYHSNGVGYTNDRRQQVFVVRIPDVQGEPTYPAAPSAADPHPTPAPLAPSAQLTDGDFDHTAITFSPDSQRLAVVSARHDTRDTDVRSDIHLIDLPLDPSSEPELPIAVPVIAPLTSHESPRNVGAMLWAPSGELYFLADELGATGRDFIGRATSLYALDVASKSVRRLTDSSIDLGEIGSDLSLDGDDVLVQVRERGRVRTARVSPAGELLPVGSPDVVVTGQHAGGGRIVASISTATSSGDLAIVAGERSTPITDFSAALQGSDLHVASEIEAPRRDGGSVHGWVMLPAGEGPHPVLLNIHGGPFAAYSVAVMDEFQVYADAGYAVVFCNPRGAAGYGEDHARAIRQAMGTVDSDDVIDFLDGVLAKHPQLDSSRLGIMGGSYGGYLTAWITAHDHRFAAAIVERGFLDPFSFVGTSDIGSFFGDEYVGTDAEALTAQSPLAHVGAVTTPTFVIHSENDLRCPIEQGQRYYAALKRQGTAAELLIFPGENHELSRAGRPRHRAERFEHILSWWAQYLPTSNNQLMGVEG